jgi:hypothetical protein
MIGNGAFSQTVIFNNAPQYLAEILGIFEGKNNPIIDIVSEDILCSSFDFFN